MHLHVHFTAHLVEEKDPLYQMASEHLRRVFEDTYGLSCIEEGISHFALVTHNDAIVATGSYVAGGKVMTQFEMACLGTSNLFSFVPRSFVGEWDAIALSKNSLFVQISGLPRSALLLRSRCVDVLNATVYALSAVRGDRYLGIIGNEKIILPCCNRIGVPVECLGPANIEAIVEHYPGYDWSAYAKVGKHVFLSEILMHRPTILRNTKKCLEESGFQISCEITQLFANA